MQKLRIQAPIISIIIPAYNSEKTINRCIDSILLQRFSDFELLLIDDGSTDSTGFIIDSYCKKDNRIHVFHTKNFGVSSARNLGLRNAVGKWITFVDSDDWLDVDYIEKLYESIPNIDKWKGLVVQGYSRILQTTDCNIETICPTIKGLHSLSEEKDLLSVGKLDLTRFNFTVGKLVSKEIIEKYQVYFDEQVSFLEDLLFYLEYIKYIDSFSVSTATGYKYVVCNSDSLSYKHYPAEKEYHTYYMLLQKVNEIQTIHKLTNVNINNLTRCAEQYIIRVCRSLYYSPYRKNSSSRIKFLKQLFSCKEFYRIVRKRNGSFVDIFFCICCSLRLWFIADIFYSSWIKIHKR